MLEEILTTELSPTARNSNPIQPSIEKHGVTVRAYARLSVDTSIDSTEVRRCSAMTEVVVGPQRYPCMIERSLPDPPNPASTPILL